MADTRNAADCFGDGSNTGLWVLNDTVEDIEGRYPFVPSGESYSGGVFDNSILLGSHTDDPILATNFTLNGSAEFSLSFWFKPAASSNDVGSVLLRVVDSFQIKVGADPSTLEFSSPTHLPVIMCDISQNEWHHIVVNYAADGSEYFYLDTDYSGQGYVDAGTSSDSLTLGAMHLEGSGEGTYVDQVRFFNRKLLSAEIGYLFVEDNPNYVVPGSIRLGVNLVDNVRLGSSKVYKIYLGADEVWTS